MGAPRKYPPELKERALRLWRSGRPRRPIAHVARELGVHPEAMRTPARGAASNGRQRSGGQTS
jgi:transposase